MVVKKAEADMRPAIAKLIGTRSVLWSEVDVIIDQIKRLEKVPPLKGRRFKLLETELHDTMAQIKKTNNSLLTAYWNEGVHTKDEDVKEDQKTYTNMLFAAFQEADEYRDLIEASAPPVTPDTVSPTVENLISLINKNQTVIADNIANRKSPTVAQPTFNPSNNNKDYLLFKTFLVQFKLYIQHCRNDAERLQFLRICLKGVAFQKISPLSITEANYKVALTRLKKDYQNSDQIRSDIYDRIYKFAAPHNDPKLEITMKYLVSLETDLSELLNDQGIDHFEDSFMAYVVQRNLRPDLKEELMRFLNKTVLSLRDMFEYSLTCTRRLNMFKEQANNKNAASTKNQAAVSSISSNTKPNKKSNRYKKTYQSNGQGDSVKTVSKSTQVRKPCVFCGSKDHSHSLCTEYVTLDTRAKRIEESTGSKACRKCMYRVHSGPCYPCTEKECQSKLSHGISACPIRLQKSKGTSTNSINNMFVDPPLKSRAVALQTLVLQAHSNSQQQEYDKNVQILLDVGAQRSLVSKSCAARLGLQPEDQEITTLKGYGQKKPVSKKSICWNG